MKSIIFRSILMSAALGLQGLAYSEVLTTCGRSEVYALCVEGTNTTTLWTWTAASSDLPLGFKSRFNTTDDCKTYPDGTMLISSSGGAVALVEFPPSTHALFYAEAENAHSADLLPSNRVAVALSTSSSGNGNRVVVFDLAVSDVELFSVDLYAAHGVVWDNQRNVLWALSDSYIAQYELKDWDSATPGLNLVSTSYMPENGGHDLYPVPNSLALTVSTRNHCWLFDRDTLAFVKHPRLGDVGAVKSISIHPDSGRLAYVKADAGEWWSKTLRFLDPDADLDFPGQNFYKMRWMPAQTPDPTLDYKAFWIAASGDWMTEANWDDQEAMQTWGIPGWVSGNPQKICSGWENLSEAVIQTGIAHVTPAAKPDTPVAALDVGFGAASATLNIGSDFAVKGRSSLGGGGVAGTVSTINQTAGNVVFGTSTNSRSYWGLGDGQSIYNLSGGTMATPGDYDFFGNTVDDKVGTFVFNQTGGTFTDTGKSFSLSSKADAATTVNLSGGATFNANAATNGIRLGERGVATMNISGVDTSFSTIAGESGIGYYATADYTGTGTVNLTNGTFIATGSIFSIGRSGDGTFNQWGGTVNMGAGTVYIGRYGATTTSRGTLNMSGGAFTISNNLYIASGTGADGVVNIDGGLLELLGGESRVGNYGNGTLSIGPGGRVTAIDRFFVGTHDNMVGILNISGELDLSGSTDAFDVGAYNDSGSGISRGIVNLEEGGVLNFGGSYMRVGYLGNGTVNQRGGTATVTKLILGDQAGATGLYSISGGSLEATTYMALQPPSESATFEIVGSGATSITTPNIWFNEKTFRVKLDAGGSTPLESTGKIDLNNATLKMDTLPGFSGAPGQTFDIAMAGGDLLTTGLTLTNLSDTATFGWSVVSSDTGTQILRLTVLSEFDQWAEDYGLTGDDAAATNDYDGDGLDNLCEFGLGGDPTNSADRGISPAYRLVVEDSESWVEYIYPKRSAANSGLLYYLELSDDLMDGSWTNSGYAVTGTGTIDSEFDAVTNRVPVDMKDQQFIHLVIEQN